VEELFCPPTLNFTDGNFVKDETFVKDAPKKDSTF
jgi:hypothetical protein